MADFKCTWFFEGVQRNPGITSSAALGWTETWYTSTGSLEAALQRMRDPGPNTFLTRRLGILSNLYSCKWARASVVDNPRLTKIAPMPADMRGQVNRLNLNEANTKSAQINCAVLIDFYAPPRNPTDQAHHRRFLLRGLPSTLINGNILVEQGGVYNALIAFCNYMGVVMSPNNAGAVNNSPWTFRVQDNLAPTTGITDLTLDPANPKIILVTAPHGLLLMGQRVEIRRVTFPLRVNRIWTILADSDPNGQLHLGTSRVQLAGTWNHTGELRIIRPAFILPSQYTIIGLRNKKTGGPFRLTRGRRRGR